MSNIIEKSPLVTIIIPVYNGSNYLRQTIECALSQSYPNIEVIVVNDGSNDDNKTENIAKSFGDKIRYFSKPNGGVSSALNLGIREMNGEYFSWLSHDDLYSSDKVKDAVSLLEKYHRLGNRCVAFTGGHYISASGEKKANFHKRFAAERLYSGVQVVETMAKKGTLNGSCMLIPKEALEEAGTFDERLRYSQDALMWYRIFLAGFSLVADNHDNVMYRLHKNQTSQTRRDLYEHDALLIAQYLAEPLCQAEPTGRLLFLYAKRLTKNKSKGALEYCRSYLQRNGQLPLVRAISLYVAKAFGAARNKLISCVKKILIK